MIVKLLQWDELRPLIKPRAPDAHKGLFGHVLVIGGDYGYSGAPRLAAEAALRTGAGLVSVATRKEYAMVLNIARPEIMCHSVSTIRDLKSLFMKASIIVMGPGLGLSHWSQSLWKAVLKIKKPLVMDADALNLLAKKPMKNDHWILTPHPGEAARLLQTTSDVIQKNRLQSACDIQKKYGGICILKGADTIIASHDEPVQSVFGNPGMATAGMGDVLSGVIGGLMAQHISLLDSAKLGVMIHGMAGDLAAQSGQRGMVASDLFPHLRYLVNGRIE